MASGEISSLEAEEVERNAFLPVAVPGGSNKKSVSISTDTPQPPRTTLHLSADELSLLEESLVGPVLEGDDSEYLSSAAEIEFMEANEKLEKEEKEDGDGDEVDSDSGSIDEGEDEDDEWEEIEGEEE
eukprot:gene38220-47191_t